MAMVGCLRRRGSGAALVAPVVTLALLVGTPEVAYAATVVVPAAQTAVEGNSNEGFPFNCSRFSAFSMRTQQVYAGSAVGSAAVTQIAFRPDAIDGNAFGPTTI